MNSCKRYLLALLLLLAFSVGYTQNGESQKKQEQRVLDQREQQKAEKEQAKKLKREATLQTVAVV